MADEVNAVDQAITKKDLVNVYNKLIQNTVKEGSILARAGSSMDFKTTDITRVNVGAPSNVDEGGIKPLVNPEIDRFKVAELKLAGILPISDEANQTEEGRALMDYSVSEFLGNFPGAVDISVLAGTDPATGLPVARYSGINLKDKATPFNSASADTVDATFKAARYSIKTRGARILLSDEGRAQLSSLDSVQSGYQKYPLLDQERPTFRGLDVLTSEYAGLNGWNADGAFDNNVLGYLGDFSKISLAFLPVSVKVSDSASAGGINAFETNFTLFRVEQMIKFYIHEPESFAVVKDTSGAGA